MKESLQRSQKLVKPFRIVNGKGFRLKEEVQSRWVKYPIPPIAPRTIIIVPRTGQPTIG